MRRLSPALAAALMCAACGPGPVVLSVPFEAGDRSAVVAVVAGGRTQYWAVDQALRETQPILQSVSGWRPGERVEVHVAFFREPLDTLGLAPGLVDSAPGGRPLPPGVRRWLGVLEGSREPSWAPIEGRSERLDTFFVPEDTPCRRFDTNTERLWLETGEEPLALVRGPDDAPWLITTVRPFDRGQMRRVALDALGAPVEIPDGFRARGAADLGDGRVAVVGGRVGAQAEVLVGAPGANLEVYASLDTRSSLRWPEQVAVAASSTSGPVLYTLSRRGNVDRVGAARWIELEELAGGGDRGGIAWAEPDGLFVSPPDGQGILHDRGEGFVRLPSPLDAEFDAAEDRVESLAWIPGYEVFAGLDSGILLKRDGASFETAALNTLVDSSIEAMVPFRSGMLVGGRYGLVDQRYPGRGYCEAERARIGATVSVQVLGVFDEGVVAAGYEVLDSGDRRYFAQWLHPDDAGRD